MICCRLLHLSIQPIRIMVIDQLEGVRNARTRVMYVVCRVAFGPRVEHRRVGSLSVVLGPAKAAEPTHFERP